MFQKLYHHLEQINANTLRQQTNLEHNGQWAEKISRQLEVLNTSIVSLEKSRPRRPMHTAGLVLAGLGLILLGVLGTCAFLLSVERDAGRDQSRTFLRAYGIANNRFQLVTDHALSMEVRTSRLDSIVLRQEETILFLKKKNEMAIRTISHLQRSFRQFQQQSANSSSNNNPLSVHP